METLMEWWFAAWLVSQGAAVRQGSSGPHTPGLATAGLASPVDPERVAFVGLHMRAALEWLAAAVPPQSAVAGAALSCDVVVAHRVYRS